jgi:hypothetical protein
MKAKGPCFGAPPTERVGDGVRPSLRSAAVGETAGTSWLWRGVGRDGDLAPPLAGEAAVGDGRCASSWRPGCANSRVRQRRDVQGVGLAAPRQASAAALRQAPTAPATALQCCVRRPSADPHAPARAARRWTTRPEARQTCRPRPARRWRFDEALAPHKHARHNDTRATFLTCLVGSGTRPDSACRSCTRATMV